MSDIPQHGLLELWWERDCIQRRQAMLHQTPTPWDGASWAVMVIFFGVVGLADARYRVTFVNPTPIREKLLELWPKRLTWKDEVDDETTP